MSVDAPRPGVAEPQRREDVQGLRGGAGVARAELEHEILGRLLGVVDGDVPEAVVEDARVGSSYSGSSWPRRAFSAISSSYGKRALRIEVAPAHP